MVGTQAGLADRQGALVKATGAVQVILPFKALATETGGLLSVCDFTLGGWETGPVLHRHDAVDEAFYLVAGRVEAQLGDQRVQVAAGGFLWVPRVTAHTFANARTRAPTVGPPIRSQSAPGA